MDVDRIDDPLQELIELLEDAGAVLYYTPPPHRQHLSGCTCSWPDGFPGSPELNAACLAHRWVGPAQAKKIAEKRLPEERWEGEGGRTVEGIAR